MNYLLQTRIFGLSSETSQEVTNEEMKNAYSEFLEHIENVSNGTDYSVIYRTLTATRIEIASLKYHHFMGRDKVFSAQVLSKLRYIAIDTMITHTCPSFLPSCFQRWH